MIEFIIPAWLQYYDVKIEENLHSHIVFFVMNFLNYMAYSRKTTFKIYRIYIKISTEDMIFKKLPKQHERGNI